MMEIILRSMGLGTADVTATAQVLSILLTSCSYFFVRPLRRLLDQLLTCKYVEKIIKEKQLLLPDIKLQRQYMVPFSFFTSPLINSSFPFFLLFIFPF